jgi:hypothetical protein
MEAGSVSEDLVRNSHVSKCLADRQLEAESLNGTLENGEVHTMECPVCATLNREHSRECEIEATAMLQERSRWVGTCRPESSGPDENISNVILTSRKRQMRIALRLHEHKAVAHAASSKQVWTATSRRIA